MFHSPAIRVGSWISKKIWLYISRNHNVFIRLESGASGYVSGVVAWPLDILIGQAAGNSPIKMPCGHSTTVALQKRNQMIQTYLKFGFSKKATIFETVFHLIWRLLRKCQIKWEIVSNFLGFFWMSKLYSILHRFFEIEFSF